MSKGSAPRPRQVGRAEYERRWAETFNVREYGAVGDGAHDDTDAVQDAIEALIASAGSGPVAQADGCP